MLLYSNVFALVVIDDGCQSFLPMSEQVNLFCSKEIIVSLCLGLCLKHWVPSVFCENQAPEKASAVTDCKNIVCIKL